MVFLNISYLKHLNISYLKHFLSGQGLHQDLERFKCQEFPQTLGPIGYCQNWIPVFSLMAILLYVSLNSNNLDPILLEEWDYTAFKDLKGEFDEPTCPWASQL